MSQYLQKLNELTSENQNLQARITELQRECVDLHEQLTLQQDTLSLTESDKDTVTQTNHNIKVFHKKTLPYQGSQNYVAELINSV